MNNGWQAEIRQMTMSGVLPMRVAGRQTMDKWGGILFKRWRNINTQSASRCAGDSNEKEAGCCVGGAESAKSPSSATKSLQTNLAAVGILAEPGSAADGTEVWNADHTAAPNPDLLYPIFLFASQRVFR